MNMNIFKKQKDLPIWINGERVSKEEAIRRKDACWNSIQEDISVLQTATDIDAICQLSGTIFGDCHDYFNLVHLIEEEEGKE